MVRTFKRFLNNAMVGTFGASFGVFVGLFLIVYAIVGGVFVNTGRGIKASQTYLFHQIQGHRKVSGGESLPPGIRHTLLDNQTYHLTEWRTYYYPDAWTKPGRILLMRKFGDLYYVTFGDGGRASITQFAYPISDPNRIPSLQTTVAERHTAMGWWVIPLGTIAIGFTMWIVKRQEPECRHTHSNGAAQG